MRIPYQLTCAAKKLGASIEDDTVHSDFHREATLQVVAPRGKTWIETGDAHLRLSWDIGSLESKDDAISDALARMNVGLEDETSDEER